MRLSATGHADPAFVNSKRQHGDPEYVQNVDGPDLHGAARLAAVKAVVVAKSQPSLLEVIRPMNYVHIILGQSMAQTNGIIRAPSVSS
jgi:hypothetical protein